MAMARLLLAVEDHGAGKQYVRFRLWPRCSSIGLTMIAFLASVAGFAATSAASTTALACAGAVTLVIARVGQESGRALDVLERAVAGLASASGRPSY